MNDSIAGQVFALFVIAVAAAEVGVGPGHRAASSTATGAAIDLDELDLMKG